MGVYLPWRQHRMYPLYKSRGWAPKLHSCVLLLMTSTSWSILHSYNIPYYIIPYYKFFGPLTSILHPHILLFAPGLEFWNLLVCFDSLGPFSYWQCSLCWSVRGPRHIVLVAFGVTDYDSLNTRYSIFLFYLYILHCVYDFVCFLSNILFVLTLHYSISIFIFLFYSIVSFDIY